MHRLIAQLLRNPAVIPDQAHNTKCESSASAVIPWLSVRHAEASVLFLLCLYCMHADAPAACLPVEACTGLGSVAQDDLVPRGPEHKSLPAARIRIMRSRRERRPLPNGGFHRWHGHCASPGQLEVCRPADDLQNSSNTARQMRIEKQKGALQGAKFRHTNQGRAPGRS